MARSSSGPFQATASDLPRVRAYLAARGIDYRGHSPKQAQRLGNAVARQEAAGLLPNREAARGHATTPEHPGRKPKSTGRSITPSASVREKAPAAAAKPLRAGTPRQYQRVARHPIPANQRYAQLPGGREVYRTASDRQMERIINFSADAANAGNGGRVDIEVTYADGTKQTLFTGSDHKRNGGEHAIDAATLQEMLAAHDGDMKDLIDDVVEDSGSDLEPAGMGGIVSYTLTFYPY